MEINSPISIIESQIRECFGRCAWTHKAHLKCSDIVSEVQSRLQVVQIILSTLITTGVLVTVFGDHQVVGIITAVLSAVQVGITSYMKGHDFGEISQKHSDAGSQIWDIRESYLSLLTDIRANAVSIEEAQKRRDQLQEKLVGIYKGSPRITSKAYKRASTSLKVNEDLTFSDEELDKLLPIPLRNTKMVP